MKLIVQIPVFNEEANLPLVINDIKRNVDAGKFSSVGIIVINDGSSDDSAEVAGKAGITDIADFKEHRGLGVVFREGLKRATGLGADIIVNIDADFQYNAGDINNLVIPILENKADMVIGDRQIAGISAYPIYKYMSQAAGNFLVSKLFQRDIKDSTSGLRAFSRDAAMMLMENMTNNYTYTLESICILLNKNRNISFVPIRINDPLRESRLVKNKIYYIGNYLFTVFRYFLRRI